MGTTVSPCTEKSENWKEEEFTCDYDFTKVVEDANEDSQAKKGEDLTRWLVKPMYSRDKWDNTELIPTCSCDIPYFGEWCQGKDLKFKEAGAMTLFVLPLQVWVVTSVVAVVLCDW